MIEKQIHLPGLVLTYLGWIVGLLPGIIIGWKLISGLIESAIDLIDDSGTSDGDASLTIIGLSAIVAIFVFIICWLSAMVLCPLLVFIFLKDYPKHRLVTSMLIFSLVLLLPIGILLCIYFGVVWWALATPLILFISPYFAWKFADVRAKNT